MAFNTENPNDDTFTIQIESQSQPNVWDSLTSWHTEIGAMRELAKQRNIYPDDRYRVVQNVGYEKVIYPV
jgi:hypothetical protein